MPKLKTKIFVELLSEITCVFQRYVAPKQTVRLSWNFACKKCRPRSLYIFFQKLIWGPRSRDMSILYVATDMGHPVYHRTCGNAWPIPAHAKQGLRYSCIEPNGSLFTTNDIALSVLISTPTENIRLKIMHDFREYLNSITLPFLFFHCVTQHCVSICQIFFWLTNYQLLLRSISKT